ncbi:MAG: RNA polymerase sigma factor [Bacteroidota bacterium]
MNRAERERIFQHWMQQYQGLFFKFIRAYARDAADREDLFQEIAIQVWRSVPGFQARAAESTWLYRIALNTALTWSRNRRKYQVEKLPLESIPLLQENEKADPRLEWLYEQISRLNKVDRGLVLLWLEGFAYKEIAELTGLTSSHVGVKLSRIKKLLAAEAQTATV